MIKMGWLYYKNYMQRLFTALRFETELEFFYHLAAETFRRNEGKCSKALNRRQNDTRRKSGIYISGK